MVDERYIYKERARERKREKESEREKEREGIQSTSLNWAPVNQDCRKWVGCEALAPISLPCMGAKASQPTHFLQS